MRDTPTQESDQRLSFLLPFNNILTTNVKYALKTPLGIHTHLSPFLRVMTESRVVPLKRNITSLRHRYKQNYVLLPEVHSVRFTLRCHQHNFQYGGLHDILLLVSTGQTQLLNLKKNVVGKMRNKPKITEICFETLVCS